MPGASKWGSEFLVNTTASGSQATPAITALSDGHFVAVWTDASQTDGDTSSGAIRGQVFTADGSKSGGEFLINTTTNDDQSQPTITSLPGGGFVVAWWDHSQSGGDTSGYAVRGQVFREDGSKAGGEFLVNTTTAEDQTQPTITALPDGHFVVAWTDFSQTGGDTSSFAIRGQIFTVDGSKSEGEFLVNTTTAGSQLEPTITSLTDGRFIVAWTDYSQTGGDTSNSAIKGQVFQTNGNKVGGEFLINTTTLGVQLDPTIEALPDGRFVVTWMDGSKTGGDTSGYALRGQLFNADISKAGDQFLVNTTTANSQFSATVTGLPDGRFVVAWTDQSHLFESSSNDVRAQVFNTDGSKSGAEFLVGSTTVNVQQEPNVTALPDGRFVVAWTDLTKGNGDDSEYAVRGQIYDPREAGISLLGTGLSDDLVGTDFNDAMNGLGGNDRLSGEAGNDVLNGAVGDDVLLAGFGEDRLFGDEGNDTLFGEAGNDTLDGANGNDLLFGGQDKDWLYGGAGRDTINGGLGNDRLYGQSGRDVFVFDSKLGTARSDRSVNFDRVADFNAKDDSFWLDNAVFKKLGSRGSESHPAALKKAYFTIGDYAADKNDYLVYNSKTGVLSYDADGSGSGKAVEFAQLAKHLKLTYHDFFTI